MQDLFETELWQGKTVADLLTLEFLASAAGSVIAAIAILLLGWVISSWLQHRVENLGKRHKHLDEMLFEFLASIVRYVVLGFTVLFVLNTFGVKTTSVVAVIGAAGLAIGLALQGTLSNVAAGVMLILFNNRELYNDPLMAAFEEQVETSVEGYWRTYRSWNLMAELHDLDWPADVTEIVHPWVWRLTPEAFAGLMLSRSKMTPYKEVHGAAAAEAAILDLARGFTDPDGLVDVQYKTQAAVARR